MTQTFVPMSSIVEVLVSAGVSGQELVSAMSMLEARAVPFPTPTVDVAAQRRRELDRLRKIEYRARLKRAQSSADVRRRPQTSADEPAKPPPPKAAEVSGGDFFDRLVSVAVDETKMAVSEWNKLAAEIGSGQVQKLTDTRKAKLKARLKDCGGLDGWMAALAKVKASPHCRGENDRGWRADFDFLVSEGSFVKLMEGKYDDRKPAGAPAKASPSRGGGSIGAAFDDIRAKLEATGRGAEPAQQAEPPDYP